ncbi:MAG: phenylalanyl-tRNA synthetase subunit alpha [Candidatus Phytoplasma pruni]|uniref:phenylalanine--tRNA ligase subunit alpha n=1 Tax=Poinsettia branch-inducing phytoplasma TaxID=138647 RepID=UPI000369EFEF|nr:phenylalanine--tRNA ligase subunit alpha [Poinsettia branch-inducing phytoplasma]WEK82265.1 MAG: phenylalanyl-tRNA synthetase subunit alpha [Candidatus Phytoplasma pruni]
MNPNIIEFKKKLTTLEDQIKTNIRAINDIKQLCQAEIEYIGKNGQIATLLKELRNYSLEEKKTIGKTINLLKQEINTLFQEKSYVLEQEQLNQQLKVEETDISLPSFQLPIGTIHPLNKILEQAEEFFLGMGYSIYDGKEIVSDLYNFELMNIGKEHPARDMQDSFYLNINPQSLLRTHTSSVQIQAMLASNSQPLKIISYGNVFRRDKDDATHSHQFTQLEGFVIDQHTTLMDLKQTIIMFMQHIFGPEQKLLFRPSYFPFTNPSLEVDLIIEQKGEKDVYLEVMGAGLIHPEILKNGGFDPEIFQGFAFGIGIERITMLKYSIKDIRHFYNNDMRFLKQFGK